MGQVRCGTDQYPPQILHCRISAAWKKEKWKKNQCGGLLLVFFILFLVVPASAQKWDGVIITQSDYEGLQAFKRDLIDPSGILRSWNDTGLGACSGAWAGIKCVRGQVIAIQLPWKGLSGHISDRISQLAALRKLSLHDNSVGGRVPSSLGFLPDLRGLYLFNNRLTGAVPASIGNCPLLQTLDLSNNSLVGPIPSSIANSSKLYRLNLSYNNLSGPIPVSLTRSPSLTFLSLQFNALSGPIPDTWGGDGNGTADTHQLQTLNLDNNNFTGAIPNSLGTLSKLQVLTLSNNRINGAIPLSLCNLSSLFELDLDINLLSNHVPDAINQLKNLTALSLKGNRLDGPIPASLGNVSTLLRLDLSDNGLTGGIPTSLGRLGNLNFLNVSNNNLSGPVPPLLGEKFNTSSFQGNLELCGYTPAVPCPSSPPANLPGTLPPSPAAHKRKLSTREIIIIAACCVLALLLLLCCILLCCLIKKRSAAAAQGKKSPSTAAAAAAARGDKPGEVESESGGGDTGGKLVHFDGPTVFTADDLLCATAEIMGKSTYGTVYKATLEDGNQVAVKRLREKIAKGQREFEAEVNVLGRVRHQNLLALRAYYLGPKGEKLLVFDYMPKGSLATFLHARGPETPVDWPTRMNIAMGTARGLHYLHTQESMVHGNLTSGNVLLDENADPKIADYGLSRLMTAAANSSVVATAGALGYRAPELSKLKKANTRTDVYSLGVIILELLTGKSPGEAMNGVDLPQWVASIVKEEWTNEVFDLELMRDVSETTGDELLNTLKLALHCVDPSPSARPEVQQVLQQLEDIKPELAGGGGGGGGATTSAAAGAAAEEGDGSATGE